MITLYICQKKAKIRNSITDLLDLEDSNIYISDVRIEGTRKILTLETEATVHFCPLCGYRMHSRGIKTRIINHPVLQDTYELVLKLKQRRWRCTNEQCAYNANESFNFVNKRRRNTNATDMLIINAFRDLSASASAIAARFNISDSSALEIFDRYVKMDRLPLSDILSIDEVCLDLDPHCRYALVLQDFYTGNSIDLLSSRRSHDAESFFVSIPLSERAGVNYLISDMYNPYISWCRQYFPNATPVVDSFHVIQWIIRKLENYIRDLIKKFRKRDRLFTIYKNIAATQLMIKVIHCAAAIYNQLQLTSKPASISCSVIISSFAFFLLH